ncbi:MAG: hypothetical protein ABF633_17140 [Clostridium sp.]
MAFTKEMEEYKLFFLEDVVADEQVKNIKINNQNLTQCRQVLIGIIKM